MITRFIKNTVPLALLALVMAWIPVVAGEAFVHPGGLHTQADLDRMKTKVAAGEHPWIDGWNLLLKDPKAQNAYKARPAADMGSRQRAQDDATAMYYNTLRWYISGDTSHAECAVRIANDWASTVGKRPYGDDLSGIPIGSFALAAEVLRVYPGWAPADFEKFKGMMVQHWYPKSSDFLKNHRGGPVSRCWANWDACNMLAVLGISVLCDDREKFDEAINYFKNGEGMGSIKNAVPFRHPGGLGQWQESGRDQAHVMGGMGLLSEFCQTALSQGVDLFGHDDNRLLAGAEYTAQYTLWMGVPFRFYTNEDKANQCYVSENYHGRLDASHFELLYNHYVVRKGLKAPRVQRLAELRRPEPGEIDIFGYGTLTFTLDAAASPYPVLRLPPVPLDLVATPGLGRVDLKWSPSGAYSAHGYEVFRATSSGGPYTSIYSTNRWTTPLFTDAKVESGTTYYYQVAALNNSGSSNPSAPVSAKPEAGGAIPSNFLSVDIGKSNGQGGDPYAGASNHSFVIPARGADIGGKEDSCHYLYNPASGDFTITARLIDRKGTVNKMGLMMRESTDPKARMLAVTLGETGGRQARFGTRPETGGSTTTQAGNDYTWLPVWFRLQRVGDVFTGSQSSDGVTWFKVGTSTVPMAKDYLVGLTALAGKAQVKPGDSPATAAFDQVSTAVAPPPPPAAPTGIVAITPDNRSIQLEWKGASTPPTGFKIEASSDNGIFYEIADLEGAATRFVNTGLQGSGTRHYRVRAYNGGGYSDYSDSVERR